MADLNEADFVFSPAKRLDQSVDAIAGDSEYRVHPPIDQSVDEHVARGHRGHERILSVEAAQEASPSGARRNAERWCNVRCPNRFRHFTEQM